ncbi:MAG: hypothetical protein ACLTMW_05490 [Blautia hydrogenotrophica]
MESEQSGAYDDYIEKNPLGKPVTLTYERVENFMSHSDSKTV